jgi:NAD dependent epimerase/dehydratase family enzyme
VPEFAVRTLYGQMAEIVAEGQRAVPQRTLQLGYDFRHAELEPALKSALGKG